MAFFTEKLRLIKQNIGENDQIWGDALNSGFIDLADEAVAGVATVDMSGGDTSLTDEDGASSEARAMFLTLTGTPAGPSSLTVPRRSKLYAIRNETPQIITIKPLGGTGDNINTLETEWFTVDEATNRCFNLLSSGTIVPFTVTQVPVTASFIGSIAGDATKQFNSIQEGTQFAIGWDTLSVTVAAIDFVAVGFFPTAPVRQQSYQLFIQEGGAVIDAYAVFTTQRIEFFKSDGSPWINPSVRTVNQTWLQYNQALN